MYTVYADDMLIHDQQSPDLSIHLVSPKLSLKENSAGSFTFVITPDHIAYDSLQRMVTLISIRKENNTIWTGRILTEKTDFYNCKTFTCEGALAYLNDTLQEPKEYLNNNVRVVFRSIIEAHNSKVDNKRKFQVGSITVQDFADPYWYETNYNTTWDTIKEYFLDRLKGHLIVRYNGTSTSPIIDYEDVYTTSQQEINFGENLLNFTRDYDLSQLYTAIFPKGKEISKDSDATDASNDTNVKTSNRVTIVNNVTIGYSVIESDIRVTVKLTSISVANSVSYSGEHSFKITIGEEEIVSKNATYTTSLSNGRTIKHYQAAIECANVAKTAVMTKINKDDAKATWFKESEITSDNLVINIFGRSSTIKINIPKVDEEASTRKKKEYTTIASVNNGSVYLENSTAIARYGRIEKEVDFNDVDNPSILLELARIYLDTSQFDEMSIVVSAVDLHSINPSIQSLNFLNQVRCISEPHGMNKLFPITGMEIPLDDLANVTYTLGYNQSTAMSSQNTKNSDGFYNTINNMPSLKRTLDAAKGDMTEILNRRTNGFVNIVQENDVSQALIISDTADWTNANKLWKFDINGLGYSDSTTADVNYDGPASMADGRWYKMGITMDGSIVADVIKTGVLEDGMGYNYWNMVTGEFSMQPNTIVLSQDDEYTLADMWDDLTTNTDNITKAANDITKVDNHTKVLDEKYTFVSSQETGGATNLLNGTGKIKLSTNNTNTWSRREWTGNNVKIVDCNVDTISVDPPNTMIQNCIQFCENHSRGSIAQINIGSLDVDTAYCLSCYALGTGILTLLFDIRILDKDTKRDVPDAFRHASISKPIEDAKKWVRVSIAFKTAKGSGGNVSIDGSYSDTSTPKVTVLGDPIGNGILTICGLKLEKGNAPTDWQPSIQDINDTAVEYDKEFQEVITEEMREAIPAQIRAYDRALTHEKILGKLTDGFKNVGIYSKILPGDKKPSLLINASYIRSGALSAGLIQTGWIRDQAGQNQWNLTTGYFETTNMRAVNMMATGIFQSGEASAYSMQLGNGCIEGYRNKKWVGGIQPTAELINIQNNRLMYGITLRGRDIIEIRSPNFAIRNRNDNGISIMGGNVDISYDVVQNIRDSGNGSISWTTTSHGIKVVNGLVLAAW